MTTKLIQITPNAEENIAYIARVSNPNAQENRPFKDLLKYCIKNDHWSIFEQAYMTIEINTSLAIATQILRHRSFTFQQFCISGDTKLCFDAPSGVNKNKFKSSKMTIAEFYRKWNKNDYLRNRLTNMHIRSYDTDSQTFIHCNVKNVFHTGKKQIFRITLANGKTIKCTKEHKFLTKKGWHSLEEAVGLKFNNSVPSMTINTELACNGIPVYQNKIWLLKQKTDSIKRGVGVQGIANKAGVSYHTIRKWLKKHDIPFTKKEVAATFQIWNKGKFGYTFNRKTPAHVKQKISKAISGSKNGNWKGGIDRSWRITITDELAKHRQKLLQKADYKCNRCKRNKNLELHHIITVAEKPELALNLTNIEVLCKGCHMTHHKKDAKKWRKKHTGSTLKTARWSKVIKIESCGFEETYDLEINNKTHCYVANGIVVHNSQRYADSTLLQDKLEVPELRGQDSKNRQNSIEYADKSMVRSYQVLIEQHYKDTMKLYTSMLESGIAKECARMILPQSTKTRLYMTGSCRSWIHYIKLRSSNGTQKEHMEIAEGCKQIFLENFPTVGTALEWKAKHPDCKECNGCGEIEAEEGTYTIFCECRLRKIEEELDALDKVKKIGPDTMDITFTI